MYTLTWQLGVAWAVHDGSGFSGVLWTMGTFSWLRADAGLQGCAASTEL